ncbi:hypothetical protein BT69DRAFT_1098718 [Atractiella rhizophila]|nr:hypothetical protein BT69DRAFT_1098718 [Atractiella rhizophila]
MERSGNIPPRTVLCSFACRHHITVRLGSPEDIGIDDLPLLNHPVRPKSRPSLSAGSPFYFDKVARNASSVHLSASTIISPAALACWQEQRGIFGEGHASSLPHVFVRCEWSGCSTERRMDGMWEYMWRRRTDVGEGEVGEDEEGLKNGPEEGRSRDDGWCGRESVQHRAERELLAGVKRCHNIERKACEGWGWKRMVMQIDHGVRRPHFDAMLCSPR